MAVRTRFDPQPNGVRFFSDAERDKAYLLATPFFFEQMRILLMDGWKPNDCDSEFLFDIYKPGKERRVFLPRTFAHFLDISEAQRWRKIFENSAIFNAIKKGKNDNLDLYIGPSSPLSNIFYLLQVLAPGMLVIYYEYQSHDADVKVSRVLPPASWIESNIEFMSKTDALLAAAKNRKIAFHEERTAQLQINSHHASLPGTDAISTAAKNKIANNERTARPQNNSHHGSLPGTDAISTSAKKKKIANNERTARPQNNSQHSSLPGTEAISAEAKKKKIAFNNEKTARPQNNSQHSSLPGTDALPARASTDRKISFQKEGTSAKDQKTASSKKRKRQPRSNNSSYIVPGYLNKADGYISTGGDGYEWGMCDKDCGWCGRCILMDY